ncbi:MAG: hypothetical protein IPL97_13890 [Niastella sp.]|nr:hypothetical protein [Niastella sp.]
MLHNKSTAVQVLRDSCAGIVLSFDGEAGIGSIEKEFDIFFTSFLQFAESFNKDSINQKIFEQYSAFTVTKKLATLLNEALQKPNE